MSGSPGTAGKRRSTSGSWPGMMWSGPSASRFAELPAVDHLLEVVVDPERASLPDVVPEMGGVAGEHHPPARRRHAHHLHPARVAADEVERDAGRDLGGAVVEGDAAVEDVADGGRHVLDLEDEAERLVAHAAAGAIGHLGVLEMEAGVREFGPVAGMIPVHVAEDDVLDRVGVDAGSPERIDRRAEPLPAAACGARGVEAGVEDDDAPLAADRPDEEVERHRRVVILREHQHVALPALGQMRVAERQNLVLRVRASVFLLFGCCTLGVICGSLGKSWPNAILPGRSCGMEPPAPLIPAQELVRTLATGVDEGRCRRIVGVNARGCSFPPAHCAHAGCTFRRRTPVR